MVEPLETIFEEREELMVSPTGGNPTLRKAHFLKPSVSSIDGPVPKLPSPVIFAEPTASKLKNLALKVQFQGWRRQNKKWKMWVESLHSKYQSVWKKAGIYKAIMCSTCYIQKHPDLILGLAEKWCPETNTFIFPWGEATVTLEDMIFLWGYSVLGDSVLSPLDTKEMAEIHAALIKARKEAATMNALTATNSAWLKHFMGSGSKVEHEAFLSFWLSVSVFPSSNYVIEKQILPIAIHLARGTRIALAPAVLSNIYRDLDFLKVKLVASTRLETNEVLTLFSPFQLVHLWAWERFPTLRPTPKSITYSEPRPARWHKLKNVSVENVRLAIDSAGECFQWRPYAAALNINWSFPKFYGYEEQLVSVDAALDKGLESFARCLRVGELVGIDCIEQYLPHRVAMQFGMDQDLPGHVARYNESPEIAWRNYSRSIGDAKLYLPPRLFESDVTSRYLEWWKQSMSAEKVAIKCYERSPRKIRRLSQVYAANKEDCNVCVPPGYKVGLEDSIKEAKDTASGSLGKPNNVENTCLSVSQCQSTSNLMPDDVTVKKDLLMKPMEMIMQSEGPTGGLEKAVVVANDCILGSPANIIWVEDFEKPMAKIMWHEGSVGGLEKAMADVTDGKVGHQVKDEENSMPGLELEARISRLEGVVAELKAATFGHNSQG